MPEPAESALIAALDTAEPLAAAAIEREDFAGAMAALAALRAPIDAFFDQVTVNDPDPAGAPRGWRCSRGCATRSIRSPISPGSRADNVVTLPPPSQLR